MHGSPAARNSVVSQIVPRKTAALCTIIMVSMLWVRFVVLVLICLLGVGMGEGGGRAGGGVVVPGEGGGGVVLGGQNQDLFKRLPFSIKAFFKPRQNIQF